MVCTLSLVTLEVWNYQHTRGRAPGQGNVVIVPAPAPSDPSRVSSKPSDVLAVMEACEASDTQLDAVAECRLCSGCGSTHCDSNNRNAACTRCSGVNDSGEAKMVGVH